MRIRTIILSIVLSLLLASSLSAAQRGIKVSAKTPSGKSIPLYSGSYALVIGNGDYTKGWDPLPGAIRDVKDVARALEENGFNVTLKTNLTKNTFSRTLGDFFYKYGRVKTNRLLFYYAGHGHTQQMFTNEALGYLVMVDAPPPEKDFVGFEMASVDMQAIVTQAKKTKAKHVLFMFDSCFSGSILNLRERVVPETISDSISLPVRQFITAGRANEPVPDHSIFKQTFLDLLEGRDKEPIPDGYITGEELGLYLKNKVPEYNPTQHPQYGKIKDIRLDKGDFVFALKMPLLHRAPDMRKSGGISNYDRIIQERESNKKQWSKWQNKVENDFAKMEQYDGSGALNAKEKVKTWESFISSYGSDNPYTERDNGFRREATERIRYWNLQASIEKRPAYSVPTSSSNVIEPVKHTQPLKRKIFVQTIPTDSRVRILNIGPKFYQGMELEPGRYHVEVSAEGFETEKRWVTLAAGENGNVSIRLEPINDTSVGLIRKTESLIKSGKYLEGLKMLNKTIELKPGNVEIGSRLKKTVAYTLRGNVHTFLKQYNKAFADFDKAIELKPAYEGIYVMRGWTYLNLKQYDKAIADFDKVIELKPDDAEAYNQRGLIYVILKQYDKAFADFDKVIELKPDDVEAYNNRGRTYYCLKQYDKAIADFDKVIELKPDDAEAYNQRGLIYVIRGKADEGCDDFKKACELGNCKVLSGFQKEGLCQGIARKDQESQIDGFKEVGRDGKYIAYTNGIVKDTKTGLEWKVGPDENTNWDEARSWLESLNLDGGGWRMPTEDELADLYKKKTGSRNMTPLLKTTGWWVWSGETQSSLYAGGFYFRGGARGGTGIYRDNSRGNRAFAVRSRKDG